MQCMHATTLAVPQPRGGPDEVAALAVCGWVQQENVPQSLGAAFLTRTQALNARLQSVQLMQADASSVPAASLPSAQNATRIEISSKVRNVMQARERAADCLGEVRNWLHTLFEDG